MKVLLILVDGMRPDSLFGVEKAERFMEKSSYTLNAETVMPSVTLPCHMSLFHSVEPSRHGTTTNVYAPQVRPVISLVNLLAKEGKKCAFFYNWEELRDLTRPGALAHSYFASCYAHGFYESNTMVADEAINYLSKYDTDFAFLYLGAVDEIGHKYGWMGREYLDAVKCTWDEIDRVVNSLPDGYTVFITADHGGHDRIHGTDMPEDMTIPLFALGADFVPESDLGRVNIIDIAPSIAKLIGVKPDGDWDGKSFV